MRTVAADSAGLARDHPRSQPTLLAPSQYPTSGNANSQPELNQCGIALCPSSGISANKTTGGVASQSRKRSPPSASARIPRASADTSGAATQGEISATWAPRPAATAVHASLSKARPAAARFDWKAKETQWFCTFQTSAGAKTRSARPAPTHGLKPQSQ